MSSRFTDLEQNLRREADAARMAEAESLGKLLDARDKHIPDIQRAYAVFGDFYATILQPRGYRLIPRKKEGPTPNEKKRLNDSTILYAYVANLHSPISEQPYVNHHDDYFGSIHRQPEIGEQDCHLWHPNVALHFAATLTPIWIPAESRIGDEVKLSILMKAWGKVDVDREALVSKGISINYAGAGWDHWATFVNITPDKDRLEEQVDTGLRILTPNVINHKKAFRG